MDMNPNQELIDNLTILQTYYKQTGDKWRQTAYGKAIFNIKGLDFEIKDVSQVRGVKGIGKSTQEKIRQFLETGKIKKVEEVKVLMIEEEKKGGEQKSKQYVIDSFTKVWGIGPVKALQLYNMGYRKIEDLVLHSEVLNDQQQIGLKYYYDLLKPIQRETITVFQLAIRYILTQKFGKGTYTIAVAGSYRRKKSQSGDMDILITSTVFTLMDMVTVLQEWGLITDVLSMKDEKFMGIAHCKGGLGQHFRMDIEFIDKEEWWTGLAYFTGSQITNISMRTEAKKKGMTLSQHGLFITDTRERIPINSEEELFEKLGLTYLPPEKR